MIKPKIISFEGKKDNQAEVTPAKKIGSILVINHSMVVRKVIEKNLSSLGHTVKTVDSITEGIASLKSLKPNVIISDFKYDEISGYEFCQQIRENSSNNDIPFIFITDSNIDSDVEKQLKTVSNSAMVDSQDVNHMAATVEKMIV